jgi:hypothetical protein
LPFRPKPLLLLSLSRPLPPTSTVRTFATSLPAPSGEDDDEDEEDDDDDCPLYSPHQPRTPRLKTSPPEGVQEIIYYYFIPVARHYQHLHRHDRHLQQAAAVVVHCCRDNRYKFEQLHSRHRSKRLQDKLKPVKRQTCCCSPLSLSLSLSLSSILVRSRSLFRLDSRVSLLCSLKVSSTLSLSLSVANHQISGLTRTVAALFPFYFRRFIHRRLSQSITIEHNSTQSQLQSLASR